MKKLKLLIASMIGAIALVFACVFELSVNADTLLKGFTSSDVIEQTGLTSTSADISSHIVNDMFCLGGGKWQTSSKNQTYTNTTSYNFTLTYTTSIKATDNNRTITIDVDDLGTGTVYVLGYSTADNSTMTIGSGSAQSVAKNTPNIFTGTVDANHNVITVSKSVCINAVYVTFEAEAFDYTTAKYYTITFTAGDNGSISEPSTVKYYYEAPGDKYNNVSWPTATSNDKYYFKGWFNGETKYTDKSSFSGDITLTAMFEEISIVSGSYIFGEFTTEQKESGIVAYTGSSANYAITWNDGTSMEKGKGQTITKGDSFIVLRLYEPARIKFYGVSNNNGTKTTVAINKVVNNNTNKVYELELDTRTSTNAPVMSTYLDEGVYKFSTAGQNVIAYKMDINYVSSRLLKQFDNDLAPTKLRLIGEINGIAHSKFEDILSVLIEFDFNEAHKEQNCYSLYKSVATVDNQLTGGDNIMYVVLTINGVNKYKGQNMALTNVKMTITFEDDSQMVVTRDDIAIA